MSHFNQLQKRMLLKATQHVSPATFHAFRHTLVRNPLVIDNCVRAGVSFLQKRSFFSKPTPPITPNATKEDLQELQKALDEALSDVRLNDAFRNSTSGSTSTSTSTSFSSSPPVQRTINEALRSDLHTAATRLFALEKFVNVMLSPAPRERGVLLRLASFLVTTTLFFFIISFVGNSARSNGLLGGDSFYDVFDPNADPEKRVFLSDVKGIDPIVSELADVIDMINNSDKYNAIGASVPRGILLTGEPGTGKTMLAKAIATECGVKFFSLSASSFETGFVGGGASNIRSIFAAARREERCIIFIDELDSIMSRSSSQQVFNGRYLMQTLNALLVEMDGFTPDDRVTVIAATNFPQGIDEALKRPGRFDLQIHVPMPDLTGRIDVLNSYLVKVFRSASLTQDDVRAVAKNCAGQSSAFLKDLVNTAALVSAKRSIAEQIWDGTYVPAPRRNPEDLSQQIEQASRGALASQLASISEKTSRALNDFGPYATVRDALGFENPYKARDELKARAEEERPNITQLSSDQRMRFEEDANAFFAEHDPRIGALVAQLRAVEQEIAREMPFVDRRAIRRDERWHRIFEAIRDERERVLTSQKHKASAGVTVSDLERARELLSLGVKRTGYYNTAFDEEDKMRVAVTRVGAALTAILTPACDKVSKITVLPRGDKLGGIMMDRGSAQLQTGDEENDATSISHEQLLGTIRVALAGRAAEEVVFGAGNISGESAEGLKQAFNTAQRMITKWGFSQRAGMFSVLSPEHLSEENKALYDQEISALLQDEQKIVRETVHQYKDQITALAKLLIQEETLTGDQVKEFLTNFSTMRDLDRKVKEYQLVQGQQHPQ